MPQTLLSCSLVTSTLPVSQSSPSSADGHLTWVSVPAPGYTQQLSTGRVICHVGWENPGTLLHSFKTYPGFDYSPHSTAPAAAAKSLQSCPTLCDPIDGSPPGSSVPGILQARTLEWVDVSFSTPFHCWHPTGAIITSLLDFCDDLLNGSYHPARLQSVFNISLSNSSKMKSGDVSIQNLLWFPVSLNVKPKALKSFASAYRMWLPILPPKTPHTPVLLQHMNCIVFLKHIAQQKPSPFMVPLSSDSSLLPPVFCGFICLEEPTDMQNPSFKWVSRCDSSPQFL